MMLPVDVVRLVNMRIENADWPGLSDIIQRAIADGSDTLTLVTLARAACPVSDRLPEWERIIADLASVLSGRGRRPDRLLVGLFP